MKTLKLLDLLRYRLIVLSVSDEAVEKEHIQVQDLVLVQKDGEELVAKVLSISLGEVVKKDDGEDWKFKKKLNATEIETHEKNQEDEKKRVVKAQKFVEELKLDMRFFASKVGWKKGLISFFFTCEEAVDFRELLKLLGSTFKCRVHLERVGARDKAKIVGGYGICGKEVCCSTFRSKLTSVPMDAVRDQGIMIKDNHKLLGVCGKLKCCFMYELPHYREMRKHLPHIRQSVLVDTKQGRVIGIDILNQKVKVLLLDTETVEIFDAAEVQIESGKRREQKKEATTR